MKKIIIGTIIAGVLAVAGFTTFGVLRSNAAKPIIDGDGYVLSGDQQAERREVPVKSGTAYANLGEGLVKLKSSEGKTEVLPQNSFVFYGDATSALSDGILLDFNDLEGNFINNYSLPTNMKVYRSGSAYEAQTGNGSISFGDHLWKLSDQKYLIESPTLKIVFSTDDIVEAKDYVQVSVSEDGVVCLLTSEEAYTTISKDCYVETAGGAKVYPLTQIIEHNNYRLTASSLSTDPDDVITLTADETRRQIVPELIIHAEDGDDGSDGRNGEIGIDGDDGTDGNAGTDGQDGSDGDDGAAGTAGTAGSSGSSGSNGTLGISGVSGTNGSNGVMGADGGTGQSGGNGDDGEDRSDTVGATGKSGSTGVAGEQGKNGVAGTQGDLGTQGSEGTPGLGGDDGKSGTTGGTGAAGRDASSTSSINSTIPEMSIVAWNVTTTGLSGSISIQDPSKFLEKVNDNTEETRQRFKATVTIYDDTTGKVFKCYPDKPGATAPAQGSENFFTKFNTGDISGAIPFYMDLGGGVRDVDVLEPDHTYRLEVGAYYSVQGAKYYRTFINRTFYTDTSGVVLSSEKATEESVTVTVGVDDSHVSTIREADVYLLTPDRNSSFSMTNAGDYVYKYKLEYTADGVYIMGIPAIDPETGDPVYGHSIARYKYEGNAPYDLSLQFVVKGDGDQMLPCNTDFVARVIVKNNDGAEYTYLTPQELEVSTLTKGLTWNGVPKAVYNRVDADFEVYRPAVSDESTSVQSYRYTVYKKRADGTFTPMTAEEAGYVEPRIVDPGAAQPVKFVLPTGEDNVYKFDVTAILYDNEKEVEVDLGLTDEIKVVAGTMPEIRFAGAPTTTYNQMEGKILINLTDASTFINVDPNSPLILDIYGDEVYENSIEVTKGEQSGKRSERDVQTGRPAEYEDWWVTGGTFESNAVSFNLKLANLYANQKYTIKISGYVNLGEEDASGGKYSMLRDIGSVTFWTTKVPQLTGNWTTVQSSRVISTKLSLSTSDTTGYTVMDLTDQNQQHGGGRVDIYLYENSEKGNVLGTRIVSTQAEMVKLFGTYDSETKTFTEPEGLELDDSSFGNLILKQDGTYVIKVVSVTDATYNMSAVNYTNVFTNIASDSKLIAAVPQPPALPSNPASKTDALKATPIYNGDTHNMFDGAGNSRYNEELPDDAIVGYTLAAQYDNSSRLAKSVTYYALEYNTFYNALCNKQDPIGNYLKDETGAHKLMEMTQLVGSNDTVVPKVTVFFGGTKGYVNFDAATKCFVYESGPVEGSGDTLTGLDRGYRYAFAYVVEYSNTGEGEVVETNLYPYDHSDYERYKSDYGIGVENGSLRFCTADRDPAHRDPVAYVLNSGMISVPKIAPVFNTYLKKSTGTIQLNTVTGAYDLQSQTFGTAVIAYHYTDEDHVIDVGSTIKCAYGTEESTDVIKAGDLDPWATMSFNYKCGLNGVQLTPAVEAKLYELNYDPVLLEYQYQEDNKEISIGAVIAGWDYDGYLTYLNQDLDADHKEPMVTAASSNNFVTFTFGDGTGNDVATLFCRRAYAVELTASKGDQSVTLDRQTLQIDSNGRYYCRIFTGELGTLGTGNITFRAKLLYDNGNSGWDYVSYTPDSAGVAFGETSWFALTDMRKGRDISFTMEGYYTSAQNLTSSSSGSLFAKLSAVPPIESCVVNEHRIPLSFTYAVPGGGTFDRFGYPFTYGVDASTTNNNIGSFSGDILIPEGASSAEATVSYESGGGGVEVLEIVPIVNYQDYISMSTSVALEDFNVKSLQNAETKEKSAITYGEDEELAKLADLTDNYYELRVAAYLNEYKDEAGQTHIRYDEAYAKDLSHLANATSITKILLNENGTVFGTIEYDDVTGYVTRVTPVVRTEVPVEGGGTVTQCTDLPSIYGLQKQASYYITYYMDVKQGSATTGTPTVIVGQDKLNSHAMDVSAVYKVVTTDDIQITFAECEYNNYNDGYFGKKLVLNYGVIPRVYGLTMRYEIYTSKAAAEAGVDPYINLMSGAAYDLLVEPGVLSPKSNIVTVDLTPGHVAEANAVHGEDEQMSPILPGGTYWLRVTAMNGAEDVGYGVRQFGTKKYNYGVSVTAPERTASSIDFNITFTDTAGVFMGYHREAGDTLVIPAEYEDEGLYAVRFTDMAGDLIPTKYDSFVYSFADMKKLFVLGNAVRPLAENTSYYCNVYAVKDLELDGLSEPVVPGGTSGSKHDWKFFFSPDFGFSYQEIVDPDDPSQKIGGYVSPELNNIIRRFWDDDGKHVTDTDTRKLENAYRVRQVSKETTSASGIIIPAGDTYKTWQITSNNTMRITVKESAGVVTGTAPDEQQGFYAIDWNITDEETMLQYTGTAIRGTEDDMFHYTKSGASIVPGSYYYDMVLDSGDTFREGKLYAAVVKLYETQTQYEQDLPATYTFSYIMTY